MSCSRPGVTCKHYTLLIALACAVMSTPLHAASEEEAPRERDERAAQKSERPKKDPSRFEACRREARGKHGPERASFMTECLQERHPPSR